MGEVASQFCSLTETTTVTGGNRLPAPFRCSAPHSPPGWPVSQVHKDEVRIPENQSPESTQSAVDCQRNWTAPPQAHYRRSPNFISISRDHGQVKELRQLGISGFYLLVGGQNRGAFATCWANATVSSRFLASRFSASLAYRFFARPKSRIASSFPPLYRIEFCADSGDHVTYIDGFAPGIISEIRQERK